MDESANPIKLPAVLVSLLLCAIGLGTVLYLFQQDAQRSQAYSFDKAAVIAAQIAAAQQNIITNTETFLHKLAGSPALQDPGAPACRQHLAMVLDHAPMYVNLGVPRADGELLCNARPLDKRVNVFDRGYFQRSLQQRVFAIGEFQLDRAAGVSSVNFAYPVLDPATDQVTGIAVAVVSLDWWSERLADFRLPPGSIALITDRNGAVVANYPLRSDLLGKSSSRYAVSAALQSVDRPSSETVLGDDAIARAFAHEVLYQTPESGRVTVSVGIPLDRAPSAVRRWMGYVLVLLVLLVVGLLVMMVMGYPGRRD